MYDDRGGTETLMMMALMMVVGEAKSRTSPVQPPNELVDRRLIEMVHVGGLIAATGSMRLNRTAVQRTSQWLQDCKER